MEPGSGELEGSELEPLGTGSMLNQNRLEPFGTGRSWPLWVRALGAQAQLAPSGLGPKGPQGPGPSWPKGR